MAHYAIEMTDGSVAIMETIGDVSAEKCVAKWTDAARARILRCAPLDPSAIPGDRSYRAAWTVVRGSIDHDMTKARAIHRDRLRAERAPLLTALDVAYQKADEVKDDAAKAVVAARKQKLRDATAHPAIDKAQTVVELKALTLAALT
jgi:hypothetical protein